MFGYTLHVFSTYVFFGFNRLQPKILGKKTKVDKYVFHFEKIALFAISLRVVSNDVTML